jgi:hypothetical protein
LQPIDGFVMTTGTAVPLDSLTLKDILSTLPFGAKSAAAVVEDYRFQIAVFRAYLTGETGMRVEHRDFGEPLETEAA